MNITLSTLVFSALLLSQTGVSAAEESPTGEVENTSTESLWPSRTDMPHRVSFSLDLLPYVLIPNPGLVYRNQVDSEWGFGIHATLMAQGASLRKYFSPHSNSSYLEVFGAIHPLSFIYGKPNAPYFSLNGRYGWEFRWTQHISFNTYVGLGAALIEQREIWGLVNFGAELLYAF